LREGRRRKPGPVAREDEAPEPTGIRFHDPEEHIMGKRARVRSRKFGYINGIVTGYEDCHPKYEYRKGRKRHPKRVCGFGYPRIRVLITDPDVLASRGALKDEDWYPLDQWEIKFEEAEWE
jgi:hypothetical protein